MSGAESRRDRIVCIGNATVDRAFALSGAVELGTKNPAIARPVAFGGVARNVAETCARLGMRVSLVACVGDDDAGRAILADCRSLGIDVSGCIVSGVHPTPQYAAIVDARNELVVGASDMRAIEALSRDAAIAANAAGDLAWTFADCNLHTDTLRGVIAGARAAGHRLALDTVSVAKATRLSADLRGVDLLLCNIREAQAYLATGEMPPDAVAQALRARGAHTAIVTLGDAGTIVASTHVLERIAAMPATVADTTGAGDALIAGTIYALACGTGVADAVRTGMTVAALAVEAVTPVNAALSPAVLRERRA